MKKTQKVALTGGIIWGSTLFLVTLGAVFFNYGVDFLKVWVSVYPGYSISLAGSLVGLVYGFFDLFIGIYIIDWVYKKIS